MSCRCERMGWMGDGHNIGCPYEDGGQPWYDKEIERQRNLIEELRSLARDLYPHGNGIPVDLAPRAVRLGVIKVDPDGHRHFSSNSYGCVIDQGYKGTGR